MTDAFAELTPEQRSRARSLAETFRALGADDPESWAGSEAAEDIPQLATFLLLRKMWMDAGADLDDARQWIDHLMEAYAKQPDAPFADAGPALGRMMAAGIDPNDVVSVARMVMYDTLFSAVHTLDEGVDVDAPEGTPGWLLIETDAEGVPTGRAIQGLHESLLSMAPGGNEGRPE